MKTSTWLWLAGGLGLVLLVLNWKKLFGGTATAPATATPTSTRNTANTVEDYVTLGTNALAALVGSGGIFRRSTGNGDLTGEDLDSANY